MDIFLTALFRGFITGMSCFCISSVNDEEGWSIVGFLLGAIMGFFVVVFGVTMLMTR